MLGSLATGTEVGGREACLAAEVAAEGGLVFEAQQVGDGLHGEVVPYVEQHLGFNHHMVMNPVGQWLRPSVNWVPHCWRFEPHICMATTVNFKVRYTYSFNAAPVNVQYLKKLWTCFQKGEVVNSLNNGLTQGFFFLFFFPWTKSLKTKFLKIKLQLWGIPSSTLWNQYYKLQ